MEFKELKEKSREELEKLLKEYREKLHKLRFLASVNQLKTVHEIKVLKKTIARILTLLHDKELNNTK